MTEQERIDLRLPAITSLAHKAGVDVDCVTFIPGGKTNETFIVHDPNGLRFVARMAGSETEAFIDREKEIRNTVIASKLGVAPKFYCSEDGNLLLQYVDGECTSNQNIIFFDNNIDKVTAQLRTLNDSGEEFAGTFDFIQGYETYKDVFMSTGFGIPDEVKSSEGELLEMAQWVDARLSDDICPVHSDIVMQNFIFADNRAYLIDWEYSTMADRYLELASFCTQNILAPGAERLFLNSYFADSRASFDFDKFLMFKMSISFMWIYWHLNNVAHNKDREYNEFRWRMHLNNALMCKEEWEERQICPTAANRMQFESR